MTTEILKTKKAPKKSRVFSGASASLGYPSWDFEKHRLSGGWKTFEVEDIELDSDQEKQAISLSIYERSKGFCNCNVKLSKEQCVEFRNLVDQALLELSPGQSREGRSYFFAGLSVTVYEEVHYSSDSEFQPKVIAKGTDEKAQYAFEIQHNGDHPAVWLRVPASHPFYGKSFTEIKDQVRVHGSLSDSVQMRVGGQWFVWDYGHYGDYVSSRPASTGKKWTVREIVGEVVAAIEQFKRYETLTVEDLNFVGAKQSSLTVEGQ